ncbi:MAG: trypsin-like peptidase domain-containing protein [Patescibacteria group bacterium]
MTILCVVFMQVSGCASIPENQDQKTEKVIAEANKAVVFIKSAQMESIDDKGIKKQERGFGSGFMIREDGYMLTAWHVIGAPNAEIKACLQRKTTGRYGDLEIPDCRPAKIVGFDPQRDVALLKIQGSGYPTLKLGEDPPVGHQVIALGHPMGFLWTATVGIVSKSPLIQEDEYFTQTDASIYFGSSGGPLINTQSEVIGLLDKILVPNSAKAPIGISLAIPVGDIKILLPRLLEGGQIKHGSLHVAFGFINELDFQEMPADFRIHKISENVPGMLVVDIDPDGMSAKNGLKKGDVVIRVNGQMISNLIDATRLIYFQKPGTEVVLEVMRQGERKLFKTQLDQEPEADYNVASKSNPKK